MAELPVMAKRPAGGAGDRLGGLLLLLAAAAALFGWWVFDALDNVAPGNDLARARRAAG